MKSSPIIMQLTLDNSLLFKLGLLIYWYIDVKHKKKIFNVFKGHLASINIPPKKKEGCYQYILIVKMILCPFINIRSHPLFGIGVEIFPSIHLMIYVCLGLFHVLQWGGHKCHRWGHSKNLRLDYLSRHKPFILIMICFKALHHTYFLTSNVLTSSFFVLKWKWPIMFFGVIFLSFDGKKMRLKFVQRILGKGGFKVVIFQGNKSWICHI